MLQTKEAVGKEMMGATFAISEAVWAAGDFKKRVIEAPQRESAAVKVKVRLDNVAGVKLPVFTLVKATASSSSADGAAADGGEVLGLAGASQLSCTQVEKAAVAYGPKRPPSSALRLPTGIIVASLLHLLIWIALDCTSFYFRRRPPDRQGPRQVHSAARRAGQAGKPAGEGWLLW